MKKRFVITETYGEGALGVYATRYFIAENEKELLKILESRLSYLEDNYEGVEQEDYDDAFDEGVDLSKGYMSREIHDSKTIYETWDITWGEETILEE